MEKPTQVLQNIFEKQKVESLDIKIIQELYLEALEEAGREVIDLEGEYNNVTIGCFNPEDSAILEGTPYKLGKIELHREKESTYNCIYITLLEEAEYPKHLEKEIYIIEDDGNVDISQDGSELSGNDSRLLPKIIEETIQSIVINCKNGLMGVTIKADNYK